MALRAIGSITLYRLEVANAGKSCDCQGARVCG